MTLLGLVAIRRGGRSRKITVYRLEGALRKAPGVEVTVPLSATIGANLHARLFRANGELLSYSRLTQPEDGSPASTVT